MVGPRALHVSTDPLTTIESTLGPNARLGVAAFDTATGHHLAHRADQRFAFCSTFKLPLVGTVLAAIDAGRLRRDTPVIVQPADIVAGPHRIDVGPTTIDRLCEAAVTVSDNSAANLLLRQVGGPAAVTRFMRAHRGGPSRIDRTEPTLNTNLPGDPRDTTTPAAMVALMRAMLVDDGLHPGSRGRLIDWMMASETGRNRLRAGLPVAWHVGDKTGTGDRGANNDVAIAWPAGHRSPLLIASYVDAPYAAPDLRDAAHVAVGRLAVRRFG